MLEDGLGYMVRLCERERARKRERERGEIGLIKDILQ
jgi:hypothetical protein